MIISLLSAFIAKNLRRKIGSLEDTLRFLTI